MFRITLHSVLFGLFVAAPVLLLAADEYAPNDASPSSRVGASKKVDDFDVAQVGGLYLGRRNALGGYHGTWAQRPSYVTMQVESQLRWGTNGTSLRLSYNQDLGTCGWYTKLEGLDATAYNAVRFMIRGLDGGEDVRIGFRDVEMMEYDAEPIYLGSVDTYVSGGVSREWREVVLPIDILTEKLDARNLSQLVLEFVGMGEGAVIIDDIAFVRDTVVSAQREKDAPRSQFDSPRALYVWGIDPVDEPEAAARLLSFSTRAGVSTLLLDMSRFDQRIRSSDYEAWLKHFLERAHAEGFEVMALAGEVGWSTDKGRDEALTYVDALLEYNERCSPQTRFDGLHLDVEINSVAAWKKHREEAKTSYQVLITALAERLQQRGDTDRPFVFSVAVGSDYIREGHYFMEPVIEAVDEVVVMAYRDDQQGILDETATIASWLQQQGKRMWVAVETQDLVGSSRGRPEQTFYEEGWESMEDVFQGVHEHFAQNEVYGGLAIHHYNSYRYMKRQAGGGI